MLVSGDFSWARPLAAPHCSERDYNIKTGTALCWPRRCPQCRPMTLRLRSNLEPSSKTASIVCTAQIPPKLSAMSSTTSPCTTRITQCLRSPTTRKLQQNLSVARSAASTAGSRRHRGRPIQRPSSFREFHTKRQLLPPTNSQTITTSAPNSGLRQVTNVSASKRLKSNALTGCIRRHRKKNR